MRFYAWVMVAALAACAPLEEPVAACDAGASRSCAGCAVGALRTNLPGVEICAAGNDGGASWGDCRCSAGDAGR